MFKYESLSAPIRQSVENELAAIRRNDAIAIRLRIESGHSLLVIKNLIGHGGWLAWLIESGRTSYRSARSAERDMALAEVLYQRLDELELVLSEKSSATALYEVARKDAQADALDAALSLMRSGVYVTEQDGKMINFLYDFNERLGALVAGGSMGLNDAYAVAKRLEALDAPEDIETLAVDCLIKSPDVVDALVVMRAAQPERFAEIKASKHVFNLVAGIEVPLSEASVGDIVGVIEHEEAEQIAGQHDRFQQWKKHRAERVASCEGSLYEVLELLEHALRTHDKTLRYRVYAYPAEVEQEHEQQPI